MEKIFTRPKKGEELIGTVIDMAYGGKGIVKINMGERDYIVFISNTITGQKIKYKINKRKENYAEGRLLEIISRSNLEIKIPYQSISGAPYSTLDLIDQHKLKKKVKFLNYLQKLVELIQSKVNLTLSLNHLNLAL